MKNINLIIVCMMLAGCGGGLDGFTVYSSKNISTTKQECLYRDEVPQFTDLIMQMYIKALKDSKYLNHSYEIAVERIREAELEICIVKNMESCERDIKQLKSLYNNLYTKKSSSCFIDYKIWASDNLRIGSNNEVAKNKWKKSLAREIMNYLILDHTDFTLDDLEPIDGITHPVRCLEIRTNLEFSKYLDMY